MSERSFYRNLAPVTSFREFADPACYSDLPDDWVVFITDVTGSTLAIEAGRYKDVNVLGAASIVAALNVAPDEDIPYVFGGDGASLAVPPEAAGAIAQALAGLARLAEDAFEMSLRVGQVPVSSISEAGGTVRIAKYQAAPGVCFAMFAGGGLAVAEELVKGESSARYAIPRNNDDEYPDLEGLQCRWKPIANQNGTVLTLLVVALDESDEGKARTYRETIKSIEATVGTKTVNPGDAPLELADSTEAFEAETRVRTGRNAGLEHALYKASAFAQTSAARFLIHFGRKSGEFDGKRYLEQIPGNTDFRKFDDCLRMVIDVGEDAVEEIRTILNAKHVAGEVAFGTHTSRDALMTCIVHDFDTDHVHFIDGADGGYAMAAKEMKAQLKRLKA